MRTIYRDIDVKALKNVSVVENQNTDAILSHQMINIVYANTYGKINERIICPLKLVYKAKN